MDVGADTVPVGGSGLVVGTAGGSAPRLVHLDGAREDRVAYEAAGGYAARLADREAMVGLVEASGLRGRGGAAFPAARKIQAVATRTGPRVVVANGEEGEPASVKDRWLMRRRPHLVLDGLIAAAALVDAERAFVFASDRDSAESMDLAIQELGPGDTELAVNLTDPAYVAGEETAVIRALNGGLARPTVKPPRPFEAGVEGLSTLVANVETLANLPHILDAGPASFRSVGTVESPGTFLATVSGACHRPGLFELPLGITVREAVEATAGFADGEVKGLLMGGFFAGLLGPRGLDLRLGYAELAEEGSGLGCGAMILLGRDDCPVSAAAAVLRYLADETASQCGACIRGTAAMAAAAGSVADGTASVVDLDRLRHWASSLPGRGACGLLDGAATMVRTLLREYPDLLAEHLAGPCDLCLERRDEGARNRFALRPPSGGVVGA